MAMIFGHEDDEYAGRTEHDVAHHGDFARGMRTDPTESDVEGPDFARGEDTYPDKEGPDFARGQRELADKPDVEGPDFARGQEEFDPDSPMYHEHESHTRDTDS